MSVKNYHLHSSDQEKLERIAEDYIYMGREVKLTEGHLIVFARKVKPVNSKKKPVDKKPRRDVDSDERRPDRGQRPKRRD